MGMRKGKTMNDQISRTDAIKHLKKRLYETALNSNTDHPYYEEIADNRIDVWMNEVPSVEPESNCFGCKHVGMWEDEVEYGYPSPCTRCKRRANDNYEQ